MDWVQVDETAWPKDRDSPIDTVESRLDPEVLGSVCRNTPTDRNRGTAPALMSEEGSPRFEDRDAQILVQILSNPVADRCVLCARHSHFEWFDAVQKMPCGFQCDDSKCASILDRDVDVRVVVDQSS